MKGANSKVLRNVMSAEAFYFSTNIGQYNGSFAVDLADFCQKIRTIDVRSVDFHFKRGDFEEWIRGTLGDVELANEINKTNKINKTIQGEELRVKICQTVERRLTQLKKILAYEGTYLE